ncbi:MAG: hypothetical protein WCK05_15255, partial [Planctomycetota bacterium]
MTQQGCSGYANKPFLVSPFIDAALLARRCQEGGGELKSHRVTAAGGREWGGGITNYEFWGRKEDHAWRHSMDSTLLAAGWFGREL